MKTAARHSPVWLRLRTDAAILCLLWVLAPGLSAGPVMHLAGGTVRYENGTIPTTLHFRAFIVNRPLEVLTDSSAGCGYQDGYYWIQCASFPTPWKAGDDLRLEIRDTGGHGVSSSILLTHKSLDQRDLVIVFPNFSVTLTTNPPGLQMEIYGQTYTSPQTFDWIEGSMHRVSVQGIIESHLPGVRYQFRLWSDGGNMSHDISVHADSVHTADFITEFAVTTEVTPSGAGSIELSPDARWHPMGSVVIVRAVPDPVQRYTFVRWTGDLSSSDNPESTLITGARMITAHFTPRTYTLTSSVQPPGSGEVTMYPQRENYPLGEVVFVYALAYEGFEFDHWSENGPVGSKLASLTVDSDQAIVAHFRSVPIFKTVVVNTNPEGLPFYADDTLQISPRTFRWEKGSIHRISVDSVLEVGEDFRHRFLDWNGAPGRGFQFTADSSTSWIARFQTQYGLKVARNPELGGNVSVAPQKTWYDACETVVLEALPNEGAGYALYEWEGDISGYENPVSVIMDNAKKITALFRQNYCGLSVKIMPPGTGQVRRIPDQGAYERGSQIYVYGVPDSGYVFDHWSGDVYGTTEIIGLVMDYKKTVTAHFRESSSSTEGGVSVLPDRFDLMQNYPNPFNPSTAIPFRVPAKDQVAIEIWNTEGRKVKTVFSGEKQPGFHTEAWLGVDDEGNGMPSGVYLILLKGGDKIRGIRRAVLMK